jgi:hypothetical protein
MAVEIDRKEIYRYLGYRGHDVDSETKRLVESCVEELMKTAEPKAVFREYPIVITENGNIEFGHFRVKSNHLSKNLGGCDRVLLFAVTLGLDVDRLLAKYGKLQVSRAVVMQAAAAAMIEAYCNERCHEWKQKYEKQGWYLRPRYSPGYGDFSLDFQPVILNELDAGKQIGIVLTDGGLMIPTKSVTAVIGLSKRKESCHVEGCENCDHENCPYRRI